MKQTITLIGIFLCSLILMSCAAGRYPYPTSDLGQESWRTQVQSNSNLFAQKADQWFLAGGETPQQIENATADPSQAISNVSVRAPYFNSIKVRGNFQVQIVGTRGRNCVTIEGPNLAVRAIEVNVRNNVLCLDQVSDAPTNMGRVVVHISINQFRALDYNGSGRVEGIKLFSNNLMVTAAGSGNVFLAGHLDVKCVVANGPGSVNIFTINARDTNIETYQGGEVNISAINAVKLRSIKHLGYGDINVINATSDGLTINAQGKGKIGILGRMNIKDIKAAGQTCVFIIGSNSSSPCIYVYDDARVGISGNAANLNAYTTRTSRLMARDLNASDAYVEATGTSHMNVLASNRIFATTRDYGSIYYYGSPAILTKFQNNSGTIILMEPNATGYATSQYPAISRHMARPAAAPVMRRGDGVREPAIRMGSESDVGTSRMTPWKSRQLYA